jgi:hypothetical protein
VFLPHNSWYRRDGGTLNSPATQVYITHGTCRMAGGYKHVTGRGTSSVAKRVCPEAQVIFLGTTIIMTTEMKNPHSSTNYTHMAYMTGFDIR